MDRKIVMGFLLAAAMSVASTAQARDYCDDYADLASQISRKAQERGCANSVLLSNTDKKQHRTWCLFNLQDAPDALAKMQRAYIRNCVRERDDGEDWDGDRRDRRHWRERRFDDRRGGDPDDD